jgi:prepilin-type N-terminal cleavage/methylation domain-containing protein
MKRKGFTLIELLVVISIIAVILGLTTANFLGARGRARDAKRKSEMKEVKNALRLYYNDYQTYPAANANPPYIDGCGTDHLTLCPAGCAQAEFVAGGTDGCTVANDATIYMKRLPHDPSGVNYDFTYHRIASGDDFCLATTLENTADSEVTVSQTRCSAACSDGAGGSYCSGSQYCTCAD